MKGPVPVIPVLRPTKFEAQTLLRLQLTSREVLWDPHEICGHEYNEIEDDWHRSDPNYYLFSEISILWSITNRHIKTMVVQSLSHFNKCDTSFLAGLWGIGLIAAQRAIDSTTQTSVRRSDGHGMTRRARTKVYQRRYRQFDGHRGRFSSNVFFASCKLLRENECF